MVLWLARNRCLADRCKPLEVLCELGCRSARMGRHMRWDSGGSPLHRLAKHDRMCAGATCTCQSLELGATLQMVRWARRGIWEDCEHCLLLLVPSSRQALRGDG